MDVRYNPLLVSPPQITAARAARREGGVGAVDRNHGSVACDPRRLWAVELSATERATLESAFRRDPELRIDVGYALAGLVELGVEGVFVRSLVNRLRRGETGVPPALAVLPAAGDALEDAGWPA